MNKTQAIKELKGFKNSTKIIDGTNIAHVGWRHRIWMIIENEETFEDCKKSNFIPIIDFTTREELLKAIFNRK